MTRAAAKTTPKEKKPSRPKTATPTAGEQILASLKEIEDALKSGKPLHEQLNVRWVRLDFQTRDYNAADVKAVRKAINTSQPVLAMLMGVDPETVKAWEQGKRIPSPMASRFLSEIARDPEYWQRRLREALVSQTTPPTET